MTCAILRHQGDKKVSVAKSGPSNVTAKFMTLDGFGGRFPFNFVVDQSDESLKRCTRSGDRMIAFISQQDFWNRRISRGSLDRDIEQHRIKIAGKRQRFADRYAVCGLTLKYQCAFGIAGEFKVGTLDGIYHLFIIE